MGITWNDVENYMLFITLNGV